MTAELGRQLTGFEDCSAWLLCWTLDGSIMAAGSIVAADCCSTATPHDANACFNYQKQDRELSKRSAVN